MFEVVRTCENVPGCGGEREIGGEYGDTRDCPGETEDESDGERLCEEDGSYDRFEYSRVCESTWEEV